MNVHAEGLDVSPGIGPAPEGRILVVDDSNAARLVAKGLLQEAGYEVYLAGSAREGLSIFEAVHPELVILDIHMPEMDGFEMCRRIRATSFGAETPVLFLTGSKGYNLPEDAIEAGGDDLVYKPSLRQELAIRVRSLVRLSQLDRALRRERTALQQAQSQRAMLLRFIVHDLKSPLQAMQSTAEFMEMLEDSAEELDRASDLVKEVSGTLGRMIQDLLDVGDSESGTLHLKVTAAPARRLVEECLVEFQPQLKRMKQSMRIEVPDDLEVVADQGLLRRCVLNLLGNASKYSGKNTEIRLEIRQSGEDLLILIADQGPGIPPDMRERVFDPFVRLERDAGMARVSSGLGLAFCRIVAESHAGRIWVEDNPPHGTTFSLRIPVAQGVGEVLPLDVLGA